MLPLSPHANVSAHTIMLLTRGMTTGGTPFWAYMCIKSSMARAFREAQRRGNYQLEDYGTVLEWGEGTEPPEEVKKRMEKDFGMRHDYEEMLIRAIEQFS